MSGFTGSSSYFSGFVFPNFVTNGNQGSQNLLLIDPATSNSTVFNSFNLFKLWLPKYVYMLSSNAVQDSHVFFRIYSNNTQSTTNVLWASQDVVNLPNPQLRVVPYAGNSLDFNYTTIGNNADQPTTGNSYYGKSLRIAPLIIEKSAFPILLNLFVPNYSNGNIRIYNGHPDGQTTTSAGETPLLLEGVL